MRGRLGLAASVEAIRGARTEVRRQLREQQRLRLLTVVAVVVVIIGALPVYFVLRAAARDPVLTALDALAVPSWAVAKDHTTDNVSGSRWCLLDCRYRERTTESKRETKETFKAYEHALRDSHWVQWKSGCPQAEENGEYSCWERDEFTLKLSVRPKPCALDPLRLRPTVSAGDPSSQPSSQPSAGASGAADDSCSGALVTLKVYNAIADDYKQHGPAPTDTQLNDGLTDEDLNGDGLDGLSVSPSGG